MCNFGGDIFGVVLEGKSNVICEIFNLFVNIKCRINTREGDGGAVTAIPLEIAPEKEERLLPPPYQTNCRDNGPSDAAEKFTNPNSYQICQEMCRSELSKEMYGCDYGMTMQLSTNHLCHEDSMSRQETKPIHDVFSLYFKNLQNLHRKGLNEHVNEISSIDLSKERISCF
ncbi:hypothetical protein AVEN_231472-1 [Araneus ventricosus]|uniref:Uncharacterized protein n=1 Tax=Araneus ventricosus TaxID=182803 RepID=A0A4Y2VQD5_ARAVE|nr:hypothetical protein AVEN_231472-1 [Araneus ventricosus]